MLEDSAEIMHQLSARSAQRYVEDVNAPIRVAPELQPAGVKRLLFAHRRLTAGTLLEWQDRTHS